MSVCRLMYLTLHHEGHRIHKLQNGNQREETEDEISARRSLSASYYSIRESYRRTSTRVSSSIASLTSALGEFNLAHASDSANTVNGAVSAPGSNSEAIEQPSDGL